MARRRVDEEKTEKPKGPDASKVTLPYDTANEAIIIASTFLDKDARAYLIVRLTPDHFQGREHRELWQAFQEIERRKLQFDLSLVESLTTSEIKDYLNELCELRTETPKNLTYHVQCVLWDHARVSSARGPIPAFIEALRDPKAEPERVRALARAIGQSFDGYEDRKYLLDQDGIVRDQMKEIEARVDGRAIFPYGVAGLDFYDREAPKEDWRKRMIPGAAPSQITVVTGVSGGGKTTFTAHIVLGITFPGWRDNDFETPGRALLYGAWEMKGGMTLELLACISLGWSRSELMEGRGPVATVEGRRTLNERMGQISRRVRFMGNPFRRRAGEKASNEKNLDIVQGYIADSGAEVFVGDLWKRCLRHTDPDEEEDALIRQQAMCEELNVHAILLQQQRLKDIEQRPDKRPTREGIKGSGAWIEVADTIIGVHRPALYKRCPDNTLEVFVLKQRYGKWPVGVEFGWEPESGMIRGGVPIEYDRPGEQNEIDAATSLLSTMKKTKGRR
jgi:replicative DNA helicase